MVMHVWSGIGCLICLRQLFSQIAVTNRIYLFSKDIFLPFTCASCSVLPSSRMHPVLTELHSAARSQQISFLGAKLLYELYCHFVTHPVTKLSHLHLYQINVQRTYFTGTYSKMKILVQKFLKKINFEAFFRPSTLKTENFSKKFLWQNMGI